VLDQCGQLLRTVLSVALSSVLTLESCATASRPTWQPLDISPDPDVIRIVMQHAPGAIVEAALLEPDALKLAPHGAVSVQITVRNIGKQSLRIRSGQSELDLADGRRLVIFLTPPPPEEAKTSAEPPIEPSSPPTLVAVPASAPEEPKTSEPAKETARKIAVGGAIVVGAIVGVAGAVALYVFMPFVVAAGIVTSPIWGSWLIVAKYKQRAQQQSILDAGLEAGDVVLAHGESASAMLQFADDRGDVDAAGLRTASFVLRVSDEVARDWTAKVPLAIPK
jgi:hypothetical protein